MKLWATDKYIDTHNNGCMFFCEHMLAKLRLGKLHIGVNFSGDGAMIIHFLDNLKIYNDSHDNIIAVQCLQEMLQYKSKVGLRRLFEARARQPQDHIFMKGWHPFFMILFYTYSALIPRKIRYYDGEWWNPKKYYFPIKLDGTRLYWMEKMVHEKRWGNNWFTKLCFFLPDLILKLRWGDNMEKKVMDLYYKDPNHPTRQLYLYL